MLFLSFRMAIIGFHFRFSGFAYLANACEFRFVIFLEQFTHARTGFVFSNQRIEGHIAVDAFQRFCLFQIPKNYTASSILSRFIFFP